MPRTLIFATGNAHKVSEVKQLLSQNFDIKSLVDIGFTADIPETRKTIQGNALQKVEFLANQLKREGFAEDTGLEVDALQGQPGVYSARYAGPQKNAADNIALLLENLEGEANRGAQFRTVIALYLHGQTHTFEGVVRGRILQEPRGTGGFGYDPIFVPEGYHLTFAEMDSAEKNLISHRGIAVRKLITFLNNI